MYIDANTLITLGSVITTIIAILTLIFTAFKWYLKQEQQDKDIAQIKKEQCLLTYGVLACLKGLKERGCNGPVLEAINKIEKHINEQAHE